MTVMDRVGGWIVRNEAGSQIGARFAACVWIHTKVVVCNGQKHMETFIIDKRNSIMEATSWVCASFQEDQAWISEFSLVVQEDKILKALNYDIDVSCVQWEMWRYQSASTATC